MQIDNSRAKTEGNLSFQALRNRSKNQAKIPFFSPFACLVVTVEEDLLNEVDEISFITLVVDRVAGWLPILMAWRCRIESVGGISSHIWRFISTVALKWRLRMESSGCIEMFIVCSSCILIFHQAKELFAAAADFMLLHRSL